MALFDPSALTALGWRHPDTHNYDSPNVIAARQLLQERNGITGLETVSPVTQADYATRAAELFHRDGFVVVTDVRCLCIFVPVVVARACADTPAARAGSLFVCTCNAGPECTSSHDDPRRLRTSGPGNDRAHWRPACPI